MGSKKEESSTPTKRMMRRKSTSSGTSRRLVKSECHRGASVSEKLEALKSLVPSSGKKVEVIKPEQLFQETADYIVLLKTQVIVLQKLIDFYGEPQQDKTSL